MRKKVERTLQRRNMRKEGRMDNAEEECEEGGEGVDNIKFYPPLILYTGEI